MTRHPHHTPTTQQAAGRPPVPLRRAGRVAFAVAVLAAVLVVAAPALAVTFTATDYPGGKKPRGVVGADLDGDGDQDLAVANSSDDQVSVLLQSGGTFPTGTTSADYRTHQVGDSPQDIVAADLDGDGDTDLATANLLSNDVSVLLNTGSGSFLPALHYPAATGSIELGFRPIALVAADVTGEGLLDLVTANVASDDISVLPGTGVGTFGPPLIQSAGDEPRDVAAADFDGDGFVDVAVANGLDDDVLVKLNVGGGVLTDGVRYGSCDNPRGLVTADLDNDGDSDLVAACAGSADDVVVLLNDGTGEFSAASGSPHGVAQDPQDVVVADLDGDDDLDVATANAGGDNVSVLLGNGDGTFGASSDHALHSAAKDPHAITAGDFDGSAGTTDLVTANSGSHDLTLLHH